MSIPGSAPWPRWAAFAVGLLARPVGGAIFGHFGDRLGRKSMLMLTMVAMGLSTALIGVLPTYATIGFWAPVLLVLLRVVQGIALGGEWGGASLMVLEHAPQHRRGFFGSLVQVGFPIGLVLASAVFSAASSLPDADFKAWGWRIPFLISLVLVGVGLFVRARLPETPVFEAIKSRGQIVRSPLLELVLRNPRSFLVAIGLKLSEVSWVYMLTVFVVVYATSRLGLSRSLLLNAIIARRAAGAGDDPAVRPSVRSSTAAARSTWPAWRSPSSSPSRCSGCST